jgi:hypothetical protein
METYKKYLPKTEATHPLLAKNMKTYKKALKSIGMAQGNVDFLYKLFKRNQDLSQWLGDLSKIGELLDNMEMEISIDMEGGV